jgi:signal transduction histidine kinase
MPSRTVVERDVVERSKDSGAEGRSAAEVAQDGLAVTRYLYALANAALQLPSLLDLEHVLKTVVDMLVLEFEAALARVWLYDAAADMLSLGAQQGDASPPPGIYGDAIPRAAIAGWLFDVVHHHAPVVLHHPSAAEGFHQEGWVEREKIATAAAFPLAPDGQFQGILIYYARETLPQEVVQVLYALSAIVSASINDVQRFQREQEARSLAEEVTARLRAVESVTDFTLVNLPVDTMVREILDRIRRALHTDTATMLLLDEEAHALRVEATLGLDERETHEVTIPLGAGYAGQLAASGEPWIVDDTASIEPVSPWLRAHVRSVMGVPLQVEGRTIGVVHVGSFTRRTFQQSDLELLQLVAERVGAVIERSRLYDTERQAREEAEAAVAMRDEFLATVSHDLKNPLAAIKGRAQILRRRVDRLAGDERERFGSGLDAIDVSATRMTKIINNLMDIARLRIGEPLELRREMSDLVDLARTLVGELTESEGRSIEVHAESETIVGLWDSARLERVLGNLLGNAMKYSEPDTTIRVVVRNVDDGTAELRVEDRGIGIPEADLPHIFERFHRGSNVVGTIHGSGVGLAGARQIVEQHGGTINVTSNEGDGATFSVLLPLR